MKQLVLTLALVALTACAAIPPAPTLPPETPGSASSGDIGDWLESPNLDVRDHALDTNRADPGAYLPTAFAWVANELHRRGETGEAAKWGDFGRQRLALDIALMAPRANEDQRRFLALLPGRYTEDLGEEFLAAYGSLAPSQLQANFEEVQGLEVTAIRRYPPTWAFDAGHAYAMNWRAEPNEWSIEDLGRLNALYVDNLPTFRSALQNVIDAQATR